MILVTGITGKSGKWFLKRLITESENHKDLKIRATYRDSSKILLVDNENISIEYVCGDLMDFSFVNDSMKNISTVLHIADLGASLNIVQAAVNNNVRRLILVHTTGIYSKYKSASSVYQKIENQIESLLEKSDISYTILRPTMIYGSITDGNVIVFIKMINYLRLFPVVNHAKYYLQPVHEKDLGEAYYKVLVNEKVTKNKNYILSGKEPIMLIDMFKIIAKYLNKKNLFINVPFPIAYFGACIIFGLSFGYIDYRERVQRLIETRIFSHDEAANDFGYSPIGFEKGVQSEIEEYKKLTSD